MQFPSYFSNMQITATITKLTRLFLFDWKLLKLWKCFVSKDQHNLFYGDLCYQFMDSQHGKSDGDFVRDLLQFFLFIVERNAGVFS